MVLTHQWTTNKPRTKKTALQDPIDVTNPQTLHSVKANNIHHQLKIKQRKRQTRILIEVDQSRRTKVKKAVDIPRNQATHFLFSLNLIRTQLLIKSIKHYSAITTATPLKRNYNRIRLIRQEQHSNKLEKSHWKTSMKVLTVHLSLSTLVKWNTMRTFHVMHVSWEKALKHGSHLLPSITLPLCLRAVNLSLSWLWEIRLWVMAL